jgi:hypothetical protein
VFEIEALQCLNLERALTQDLTALHPQLNHYEVQCLMYWVFQNVVHTFMQCHTNVVKTTRDFAVDKNIGNCIYRLFQKELYNSMKSMGVRSGERGGHAIGAALPIHRPGKRLLIYSRTSAR